MSLKEELKREMRNVMKDVEKEVDKVWAVDYEGHRIEVINKMKEELLIIDGVTVDQKKRKSIISHMIPHSKLTATLELEDGTTHKVVVKLGGYVRFNCVVKIDNKVILDESFKLDMLPWDHKEQLVPYIQQQVQEHHKIVNDDLPDDEYVYSEDEPKMIAGLADHMEIGIKIPFHVKQLLKHFDNQLENPTEKTRKATYEAVISDRFVTYQDEWVEKFQEKQWDESLVQQEALWLLNHAAHREVVKFSIVLLGCTNCERYKQVLVEVGLHEEFTRYALFALNNGTTSANDDIWHIAQRVSAWGRIEAIEYLEATTPEIKHWLLTEGYKNTIAQEASMLECAVKGELDVALAEEAISKSFYQNASVLLQGLLHDDGYRMIEGYPQASKAVTHFIAHAYIHCETLEDFYPLTQMSAYLQEDPVIWEERFVEQWGREEHKSVVQAIKPFIEDRKWLGLVVDTLEENYNAAAIGIARYYRLDVTSKLMRLLAKEPLNDRLYEAIMENDHPQTIKDICRFVEDHVPLDELSEEAKVCLGYIIPSLYECDGVGKRLIEAALLSDSESLRYDALFSLEGWSPSFRKEEGIWEAIQYVAVETTDKDTHRLAKRLLKTNH